MAKAKKIKKGAKLVCLPCGREVTVNNCGISTRTIWCCARPMKKSSPSLVKKIRQKLFKKRK